MAWEVRNGNRYYYRSRREGDQVIREYIGNGEAAELLALLDSIERDEKMNNREAENYRKTEMMAEDSEIEQMDQEVDSDYDRFASNRKFRMLENPFCSWLYSSKTCFRIFSNSLFASALSAKTEIRPMNFFGKISCSSQANSEQAFLNKSSLNTES